MQSKYYLTLVFFFLLFSLYGQNQLLIPDTISGTDFELKLQKGEFKFFEGQITSTMGVNGNILGPTLIMHQNDFVDIKVNNQLEESTTIHWHGMHVSAANDGGPHTVINPGETWNPKFTVLDKAGTYWYHPHLHENTNRHVSLGIAGFILVKDEDEARLNLPRVYGVDDFPLVIQTKDFDENNQVVVPSNSDDVVMVNATIEPYLEVPAQVVRLRLLNGSSQRTFNLGLSNNHTFYQIASDGGLLENPVELTRLRLSPGERAEILIDFTAFEGSTVYLKSFASELPNGIYGAAYPGMGFMMQLDGYNPNPLNGTNYEVLELRVKEKTENSILSVPEKLVEVKRLNPLEATQNRSLTFNPAQMGPNQLNGDFLINGLKFDMDVVNFSIPLNNIEIWSLSNFSGIAHPFHIHDVQFYILDRNGIAPPENELGRKDVVLVQPMETVRFITQFKDFANDPVPYMLHCHMLTHEDKGMMLQFEVVDNTTNTIDLNLSQNELSIFPNPLNGNKKLTIKGLADNKVDFFLYNTIGQLLIHKSVPRNSVDSQVDLSSISPGTYLININQNSKKYSHKLIINK